MEVARFELASIVEDATTALRRRKWFFFSVRHQDANLEPSVLQRENFGVTSVLLQLQGQGVGQAGSVRSREHHPLMSNNRYSVC